MMTIKIIMRLILLLVLPLSMDALYASQDGNKYQLSGEDQMLLEYLHSIRTSMGVAPLTSYDFAQKDGLGCQLGYLSANKDNVKCDDSEQSYSKRNAFRFCHDTFQRWMNFTAVNRLGGYAVKEMDFIPKEFYDCESKSITEAFEQLLGNPYHRLHLLHPFNVAAGWTSGSYKDKPPVMGISSRILSRAYYQALFDEAPVYEGSFTSSGVMGPKLFSWEEKLDEYCLSSDTSREECIQQVSNIVKGYFYNLIKLEVLFGLKSETGLNVENIPHSYFFCANRPFLQKHLCPRLVKDLRPLIDSHGDAEEAFFSFRDELLADSKILGSVMATSTPFYAYPFDGNGKHKFLTSIDYAQRQKLDLPPYLVQGLPVTVQFDETVMHKAKVYRFSLKDEHGNQIPVVTEFRPGDAWIFYPMRRLDRATRYTVAMGFKADDFAEGAHDAKWSFETRGAEANAQRLYRLGSKTWNDDAYSRDIKTDWVSDQVYTITQPSEGEQITIDVRPTVAQEIGLKEFFLRGCDGWELIKKDDGSLTVKAGRGNCVLDLLGITHPLKTPMEKLKPNWLATDRPDDLSELNPKIAIDRIVLPSYTRTFALHHELTALNRPELAEYRNLKIEFVPSGSDSCVNTTDHVFDCDAVKGR